MNPVGSFIAGYRIERVVGSGGMGTVYAVRDPQLPRTDALKVLSTELSADPQFRGRFLREADIAAMLDHPNIVSVYDRGETNGKLWIAMQFVDGTDADEALQAGTMTAHRALHIVSAVGDALDYAHGRNVLHRDVKPANFMLTGPVGPDERVLLGDFGIARAVDDAMHHTATGSIVATMPYASPEAINGTPLDGRADQYSLACSLVRLLTGKLPFGTATGVAAVMMAHLTQPPPRVSELAPWLPPALDDVITKAMAKEPADRYPNCRTFVDAALAAFTGDIGSAPTTMLARTGLGKTASKSRRITVIAAIAGVLVLVAAGTTVAVIASGPGDETARPGPVVASSAPIIPDSDLSKYLLPTDRISAIFGQPVTADPDITEVKDDSSATSYASCTTALYPLQTWQYTDSGYTKLLGRLYTVNADKAQRALQSVVAFRSDALAQANVDRQRQFWASCTRTKVTVTRSTKDKTRDNWVIGNIDTNSDPLTVPTSRVNDPASCQRALTSRRNLVIDSYVCHLGDGAVDQAVTIADQIAAKIPAAR